MVLVLVFLRQSRPKPSFYMGKVGFAMENHLFTRQNQKNHLFNIPSPFSKKDGFFGFLVLPRKRWFWSPKPTFTSQKDGFPEAVQTKTIFLRGKSWFSYEKPSFYEAKPKKTSFSKSLPHSLKKMFFFVFWFCLVPLSGQNRSALHVAMLGGSLVLVSLILISAIAFLFLLM